MVTIQYNTMNITKEKKSITNKNGKDLSRNTIIMESLFMFLRL